MTQNALGFSSAKTWGGCGYVRSIYQIRSILSLVLALTITLVGCGRSQVMEFDVTTTDLSVKEDWAGKEPTYKGIRLGTRRAEVEERIGTGVTEEVCEDAKDKLERMRGQVDVLSAISSILAPDDSDEQAEKFDDLDRSFEEAIEEIDHWLVYEDPSVKLIFDDADNLVTITVLESPGTTGRLARLWESFAERELFGIIGHPEYERDADVGAEYCYPSLGVNVATDEDEGRIRWFEFYRPAKR